MQIGTLLAPDTRAAAALAAAWSSGPPVTWKQTRLMSPRSAAEAMAVTAVSGEIDGQVTRDNHIRGGLAVSRLRAERAVVHAAVAQHQVGRRRGRIRQQIADAQHRCASARYPPTGLPSRSVQRATLIPQGD